MYGVVDNESSNMESRTVVSQQERVRTIQLNMLCRSLQNASLNGTICIDIVTKIVLIFHEYLVSERRAALKCKENMKVEYAAMFH